MSTHPPPHLQPEKSPQKRAGLRGKFILLLVFTIALSLGYYTNDNLQRDLARERAHLIQQGELLGHFIALVSPEAILSFDLFSLNDYMREANGTAGVVYAVIIREGNPLSSYLDRTDPVIRMHIQQHPQAQELRALLPILQANHTMIEHLIFPISSSGKLLGNLHIGINLTSLEAITREQIWAGIWQALMLIVLLSGAIFIIFQRYALRPIDAILAGIYRANGGNLTDPIKVLGDDELGDVAHSLNNMMHEISRVHSVLRQREGYIRLLMNSGAEGVIGTDKRGICTFVNRAAIESLGYSEAEILGKDIQLFCALHEGAPDLFRHTLLASVLDGDSVHRDTDSLRTHDQQLSPIEYWLQPIKDQGAVIGAIFTFIDIKARRVAEQQLQRTLISLDSTIKERTLELSNRLKELEQTRSELIQSEKMASLGRMVAGFAHELNTPIGVAVGASSQLRETLSHLNTLIEQDEVEEKELMVMINVLNESADLTLRNLKRAAKLVSTFRRTATNQYNTRIASFDLCMTAQDVISSLSSQFRTTHIEVLLQCEQPLTISSRPDIIIQTINNLLLNGLQHGFGSEPDRRGTITLRCIKHPQELSIVYIDNGVGMDESTREKIFEPFFTTARNQGGSGLGLYVIYNLITTELHGTISCDSTPGYGTHIDVRLPLSIANVTTAAAKPTP